MTGEFVKASKRANHAPFSMIEQKGLGARLAAELKLAAKELTRDPRGFIRDLFADEGRDVRRRRLFYRGLTCAAVIYAALFVVMIVVGWPKALTPEDEETQLKLDRIISFAKDQQPDAASQVPRGENGGGGGGGNHETAPASFGRPPEFAPQPSPVTPTTHVPPTPLSMPIQQTIQGAPSLQPKFDATLPIGDPAAAPAPPSDGSGDGGGIGKGNGPGVGPGGGPGAGKGSGGNEGKDRPAGSPDGTNTLPTGPINWNDINRIPDSSPFRWLSRPRPVVTPEALAKKVIGEVLLRATFNANGTVSDIEVIRTDVPEMTESAIDSLARSTFRPATVKGVAVTVRKVPVRVSIHY